MLDKSQVAGHGLTALIVLGGASMNMQPDHDYKLIRQDINEIKDSVQQLSEGFQGFKEQVNGRINLVNYRLQKVEDYEKISQ
ncbi:hypothetical protein ACFOEK_12255 [Litoribrevibacter euphylliae]|uniref:Uncharacterized protein n=1 Tax=Litoribrevibacter euphylliae TaxID=1834034 RepID=A0ABV7HD33_9GAMM